MGIQDRDYMRRDNRSWPPPPRGPTSHRWEKWLVIAAATIAVLSYAVWLARDARDLFGSSGPAEGCLRVNVTVKLQIPLLSLRERARIGAHSQWDRSGQKRTSAR